MSVSKLNLFKLFILMKISLTLLLKYSRFEVLKIKKGMMKIAIVISLWYQKLNKCLLIDLNLFFSRLKSRSLSILQETMTIHFFKNMITYSLEGMPFPYLMSRIRVHSSKNRPHYFPVSRACSNKFWYLKN